MLLEFQTLFPGLTNIMDMGVGAGGEPKAGFSIHLNRKVAIVSSLKYTDSHSSLVWLVWSLTAI